MKTLLILLLLSSSVHAAEDCNKVYQKTLTECLERWKDHNSEELNMECEVDAYEAQLECEYRNEDRKGK